MVKRYELLWERVFYQLCRLLFSIVHPVPGPVFCQQVHFSQFFSVQKVLIKLGRNRRKRVFSEIMSVWICDLKSIQDVYCVQCIVLLLPLNCPFTSRAQYVIGSVSVCLQIWQPGLGQGEWVFSWTLLAEWNYWNGLIFSQTYFYGDMYVLQDSAFGCNTLCVCVCVCVSVYMCVCACACVCVFSLTGAKLTQNIFLYLWLSGIRQCSTCTYIWLCNRSGTKLIRSLIFLFS